MRRETFGSKDLEISIAIKILVFQVQSMDQNKHHMEVC